MIHMPAAGDELEPVPGVADGAVATCVSIARTAPDIARIADSFCAAVAAKDVTASLKAVD